MKRAPADIPKISKEQVLEASKLSAPEARFLVSNYYDAQDARKRADMQLRHLGEKNEYESDLKSDPGSMLAYTASVQAQMEKNVLKALEAYAGGSRVGQWILAQYGVGPVIAAGLLAHVDIERAPTVGHIWRFAGLDPTCEWKKGEKRPFNPKLKQICWHAGQCFKRTYTAADSYYGKLYAEKKKIIVARNESGEFAERAKTFFTKSADVKKTLKTGKLPAGNLDSQAARFAVKIFLSHMHAVWFWDKYKRSPPHPFAIAILGHGHEIRVPMTDMFPGFEQAYYGGGMMEAAE